MLNKLTNTLLAGFLLLATATASHAETNATFETNATLMAKGEWKDPATGLIWQRCSIGQEWTGSTCIGKPIKMNWHIANDYLTRCTTSEVWKNGKCTDVKKLKEARQYLKKCTEAELADGTCAANKQKLNEYIEFYSKQNAVKNKNKKRRQYYNQDVNFNGRRDWRLPTISEFSSIRQCTNGWDTKKALKKDEREEAIKHVKYLFVDTTNDVYLRKIPNGLNGDIIEHDKLRTVPFRCAEGSKTPTINDRIFPNTPAERYWSASTYALGTGNTWHIAFNNGQINDGYYNYDKYNTRLVRSAPALPCCKIEKNTLPCCSTTID